MTIGNDSNYSPAEGLASRATENRQREEAIRAVRELLERRNDLREDWRTWAQHFIDEFGELLAQGGIEPNLLLGGSALALGIWVGVDDGPTTELIGAGVRTPTFRSVVLTPAPGYRGATSSIAVYTQEHSADPDPTSLGWFRVHDIDFSAPEKPQVTIGVNNRKKLEATARQGGRRLRVTWSLWPLPSTEREQG